MHDEYFDNYLFDLQPQALLDSFVFSRRKRVRKEFTKNIANGVRTLFLHLFLS